MLQIPSFNSGKFSCVSSAFSPHCGRIFHCEENIENKIDKWEHKKEVMASNKGEKLGQSDILYSFEGEVSPPVKPIKGMTQLRQSGKNASGFASQHFLLNKFHLKMRILPGEKLTVFISCDISEISKNDFDWCEPTIIENRHSKALVTRNQQLMEKLLGVKKDVDERVHGVTKNTNSLATVSTNAKAIA